MAEAGSEVMIHVTGRKNTSIYDGYYANNNPSGVAKINSTEKAGLYTFGKITSIDDVNIVFEKDVDDEFTLDSELIGTYYVQVLIVPNFASPTVDTGVSITPIT